MEDIKLAMTIPFKPEQWTFTEMEDKVSRPSMESINASLKQKGINVDFFIKMHGHVYEVFHRVSNRMRRNKGHYDKKNERYYYHHLILR